MEEKWGTALEKSRRMSVYLTWYPVFRLIYSIIWLMYHLLIQWNNTTIPHSLFVDPDNIRGSRQFNLPHLLIANTFHFSVSLAGTFCPGTWDGWLCWPDTKAGSSAYVRCPEFKTGFDPDRKFVLSYYFLLQNFIFDVE